MGAICSVLMIGKLAFRAFIYNDMYIAPGEPVGISDVIVLYLYLLLLLLFIVSVLLAIALFIWGEPQSKKSGLLLVLFCVVLFFASPSLYSLAGRLSS
ncbi:hypothetical protein [Enterovibrio coralii]|nr:hypothetical protein [Enterovibrio coralii]